MSIRRLWSALEKRRIVAEALAPGARVADVARKYTLNLNQLYAWCRAYRGGLPTIAGSAIVPIEISDEGSDRKIPDGDAIEITTPGGLRIAVPMSADETVLRRLFSALRRSA